METLQYRSTSTCIATKDLQVIWRMMVGAEYRTLIGKEARCRDVDIQACVLHNHKRPHQHRVTDRQEERGRDKGRDRDRDRDTCTERQRARERDGPDRERERERERH